jgi:hypothetical protein
MESFKQPPPLMTRASVDTVEIFLRRPPSGLRRQVEKTVGRRVLIRECFDRYGQRQGVRLAVNRPTSACLAILESIHRAERGSAISRVDIAIDFEMKTEEEAIALAEWIDHHLVLKWRSSKTKKMEFRTTTYWCDARKGRNLVRYQNRQNRCVVRLEMRFLRAASVRRTGLNDLSGLPHLNPRNLFDHHVKARRFTDRFKIKAMREAVAKERKRVLKKTAGKRSRQIEEFLDRYRASVPRRIRYVLDQIDAQNMGRHGTEDIDLAFLMIPDHVAWPTLKLNDNSRQGAKVADYYGQPNNSRSSI